MRLNEVQKAGAVFLLIISCCIREVKAQQYFLPPSTNYRPDRIRKIVIAETALFTATSIGLYYLWYKKHPKSRFHFFNDNHEWFQVDKAGHATTAYTIAQTQYDLLRWGGVPSNKAIGTSVLTSMAYMSIIEVLDGFSKGWGFSIGDMLANTAGAALFATQQKIWKEQRISLKISSRFSPYAQYNPSLLGKNGTARLLKDYNGQTYWLSLNIHSFLSPNNRFPEWANLAFGYGADGMINASENKGINNLKTVRYRQFYLAPDADLYRMKSNTTLNTSLYLLRFMKIPSPTLEFNSKRKFIFHPVQF